jgi:hypothetical protein
MSDWSVVKQTCCDSDGEPVPGSPITYVLYDEKDHEIAHFSDLKKAAKCLNSNLMLAIIKDLARGNELSEKTKNRLFKVIDAIENPLLENS